MSVINVLYCFDTKFWHLAAVSIESLLANAAKDTIVNIYTMVAPHTHGRYKISKIIKKHKSGGRLVWRVVQDTENPFLSYEYSRWSPVIWYRLFAHRFFKDIDKIIYLDSDTLIRGDLTELFNTDISSFCIGAVRDMAPVEDRYQSTGVIIKEFSEKYLNKGPYYNSGVLLLNIKQMQENEHLLFETKIPLLYPDQDLLNVAFCGKIKQLPLKYNCAPGVLISTFFPKKDAEEVLNGNVVIIHCYSIKPYNAANVLKDVYNIFALNASAIGMRPKDFVKWDKKYTKVQESPIPGIQIKGNSVILFGIRIKI